MGMHIILKMSPLFPGCMLCTLKKKIKRTVKKKRKGFWTLSLQLRRDVWWIRLPQSLLDFFLIFLICFYNNWVHDQPNLCLFIHLPSVSLLPFSAASLCPDCPLPPLSLNCSPLSLVSSSCLLCHFNISSLDVDVFQLPGKWELGAGFDVRPKVALF